MSVGSMISGLRSAYDTRGSSAEMRPPMIADIWLFILIFGLTGFGFLMVYSTTGVVAQEKYGDSFFYIRKQIIAAIFGTALMFLLSRINIERLRQRSGWFLPLALALLMLPLIPGLGETAGGAQRWISLGVFRFQPAELTKLSFIIFIAGYLYRHEHTLHSFAGGVVKPLLLLCPVALLLLIQPDFGSAAVVAIVTIAMAASVGVRLIYVVYAGAGLAVCGALLVMISPYRMSRVMSFLSPFNDASGKGYQLIQSLIAVGTGSIFGVGLGQSQQKLFFLPAAHTDFIFAVVAEEMGLIGALGVLLAFLLVLYRGLRLASRFAEDSFAFGLTIGLTLLIVAPALLNVGVVTGILPTKGMVLPFVGYGGSSLMISMGVVGLLLAVARSSSSRG